MLTAGELKTVTPNEAKEAINKCLSNMMLFDGRVNVGFLERSQIEYAIHLLRQYKALLRYEI